MSDKRGYISRESDEFSSQTNSDSDSESSCSSTRSNKNCILDYKDVIKKNCSDKKGKIFNNINIKCPIGPIGPTGPSGPSGMSIIGPTGPIGLSIVGSTGPMGSTGNSGINGISIVGPTGAPGVNGSTGIPGGLLGYGYIYNTSTQIVPSESSVIFDSNGLINGFIHTAPSPFVVITSSGVYKIDFSVTGNIPNQFAIFVNDVPQPSSIYGSSIGTQQNNGSVILSLNTGDVVTLVNHTTGFDVTLSTTVGGTQNNINASMNIERLQ